jgi:hypothetical protein
MVMAKDRNNKGLVVGDCVLWHDPDEETRDLTRLWAIDRINGTDEDSVILISDELGCEAEVFGWEVEKYC